eukprot:SAG31_NODE_1183_length_9510_cov_43.257040_10_plen_120_part_00
MIVLNLVPTQQNYYTLQRTRLYLGISVLFGMYRQIQSAVFRNNRQTYGFRRWPPLGCMVAVAACVQPSGKLGTSTTDDWANHLDDRHEPLDAIWSARSSTLEIYSNELGRFGSNSVGTR